MTVSAANRAALLRGARRIEIVEQPVPELVAGSVLVAIDRCGIGGQDVEAWLGGHLPAPAWFGHEWVGRVVAIGAAVTGRFEGERVVGATSPPCGVCPPCRAGLNDGCEVALSMIVGTDPLASPFGAFAEMIRVDARRVHRAPEGLDDNEAALAEPAAVAAHAVDRAGQRLGDVVAVVGAGTIGLLVTGLAHLAGAARVIAIDPEPQRRELACSLGADAAFAPDTDEVRWLAEQSHGLGADVVYECAGHHTAIATGVTMARPGGTVVLVGASTGAARLTPTDLIAKQLTLRASLGYTVADVHRALDFMAEGRFRFDSICDRVVGFGELSAVFEELSTTRSARRKVLFSPLG